MKKDISFAEEVTAVLYKIADKIEEIDKECELDIDLTQDILNISGSKGTYVINKQSVAQEIWLSSPVSGPYHFAKIDGSWIDRNGIKLFEVLSKELNCQF